MKRVLSWLLVLTMVFSMVPTAVFAEEATVLYAQTNLALAAGQNDYGETIAVPHEASVTVPADGTVTVSITSADPGVQYWFGDNLPKTNTAIFENVTAGTYNFQIKGYQNWADAAATVSFEITFVPSTGSGEVEQKEYIVSSQALTLGGNALTLDPAAVTTIYAFEPEETGVYSFTADNGAIVGYWGAGTYLLTDPGSTTGSCEWSCSAVGQSAYIGVSGVESCNLTVAKTGEANIQTIEWVKYENEHTPNSKVMDCVTVGSGEALVVNFNATSVSLNGMLAYGRANYIEEGATTGVDYFDALSAYSNATVNNFYILTEDLTQILGDLYKNPNYGWESLMPNGWQAELCKAATVEHTAGEAVEVDGYNVISCTVCEQEISREIIETAVVAGPFKMYIEQDNLDKTLYVTGAMSGYYGATSENAADGADFYTETSAEGVRIYFMDGTTKKYVEIIPSGTYRNVKFNTEPSIYYIYNAEYDTYVTPVEGEDYYLGTYNTYNTLSASKFSYISTSFPAHLGTPAETPEEPEEPEVPVVPETLEEQIAEANNLSNGAHLAYESTITGTITDEPQESTYTTGSYKFTVSDGTNSLLCYYVPVTGGTPAMGDSVTVTGKLTAYNGAAQFDSTAAAVVTKAEEPEEPEEPVVPDVPSDELVISFADKANRTEFTTETQVWKQNGITVTNLKGESTSNVADYANPARFYKNSSVTVDYPGMTKLVFTANSASYATALGTCLEGKGTVTVADKIVTLELAEAADSVTFVMSAGQVRMDQIEVFTGTTSEPVPGESAENPIDLTADLLYENDFSATVTVPAGATYYYCAYRVGGMNMSINGGEAVTCVTQGMMAPYSWSITNDGAEAAEYVITVSYPVGNQSNPDELVIGENTANIEAGSQGYYYNWTATNNGVLTITMPDGGWTYVINNMTTGKYGDTQWSDSDPVVNPGTADVAEGDVIEIIVNTYDPENMWSNPAGELVITADLFGTEENPIDLTGDLLYENDFSATVTVPAGATYYYCAYRVGGMNMSINGGEAVTCVTQGMMAPYSWSITNDGAEAAEYVITVSYPVGNQSNPDELVIGENTANIEAGSQGYYYNWTATNNGVLTITMPDGGWTYVINNMTTGKYGDTQWSDSDPVVNPGTADVAEGDVIEIIVNTYDPENMWSNPAGELVITADLFGTEENPIDLTGDLLYENDFSATVTVPAGATYYYCAYRVGGMNMSINGGEAVTCVTQGMMAPYSWSITNDGAEAAEYVITVSYPVGNQSNPDELVIGANTANIEAGSQGYYYNWTATNNGVLTITMPDGGWTYVINNMTTGKYGDTQWSDSDPVVNPGTIEVAEGDEIEIIINTYDPQNMWSSPAGIISVTASFEAYGPCTHPGLVHMDAVEPGCHYTGNIEHWYCNDCQMVWTNEALTDISNHNSVILPATGKGNVVHIEAKDPTCHDTGCVEHWICYTCEQVWTNEALTELTNYQSVTIPATGAVEPVHMEAKAPACHYDGNIEYWVCYGCEKVWQDEALTQLTNIKNVVLPATNDGLLVHNDAMEPGCHFEGNIEHWICYTCEQVWTDEALTQLSNIKNVVVPATGSNLLVHMEALEPGCHMDGHIEHWICYECNQVWTNEALTQLTNIKNVVVPATRDVEAIHVDAVAPTCNAEGNIEYWYCEKCEQVWQDEALTQLTNIMNVRLPMAEHGALEHFAAVEPGCHYDGNIEYWVCYDCEQVWQNEELTQLTNIKNVVLPATNDDSLLVHNEATAPDCHYDGCVEHWVCYGCDQVWQDAALTQKTNIKNVVVPATRDVEPVHVEAVAPTCYENGNIEYWYCEDCGQVWQDEALTQLTNRMNVVDPARHTLVHFDAVAPACHYEGNVEYWFCSECEGFWTDEMCTEVTNAKRVILPEVGGDVVHVEAKEPSCANGNIEYWYCEKCEQVWQDEALTQLTNFMRVIVPATGIHAVDGDDLIWSWNKDKTEAIGFAYCSGCEETAIFNATISGPRVVTATNENYKNIITTYNYYTATVTYNGWTATNVCVVVDPTCRHVGFTSFFGDVLIGNTVHNFPEYTKDYVMGSAWGKYEVVKKHDHVWKEEGKVGDKDYIKYCVNCNLDYKNVATGDAIMFSVIIMVLAGAAVVFMLTKKRRLI